jgi:hypothetical protein
MAKRRKAVPKFYHYKPEEHLTGEALIKFIREFQQKHQLKAGCVHIIGGKAVAI